MADHDTVTATLAEWKALVEGATEGPWRAQRHIDFPYEPGYLVYRAPEDGGAFGSAGDVGWVGVVADGEFIARARTAMPALLGFVREVRELHRPAPIYEECATDRPTALCDRDDHLELGGGQWVHESEVLYDACEDCHDEDGSWVEWPCLTEQAARKWIGGEG